MPADAKHLTEEERLRRAQFLREDVEMGDMTELEVREHVLQWVEEEKITAEDCKRILELL